MTGNETETEERTEKPAYAKFFAASAAAEYLNKDGNLMDEKFRGMATTILEGMYGSETLAIYLRHPNTTASTPQAVANAINIFSNEAEAALLQEKIGNLYGFFQRSIGKRTSEEAKKKIEFLYNQLKDKTLGEVTKEYIEANGNLKKFGNNKESEDYKKAKKIVDKYSPFVETYQNMHSTKLEFERYKAISNHNYKGLESLVQDVKLPTPEKK